MKLVLEWNSQESKRLEEEVKIPLPSHLDKFSL